MNPLSLLKYWQHAAAGLAILTVSCMVSYCEGREDGQSSEKLSQVVQAAEDGQKSTEQRKVVKHEIRKLSDPAVDKQLSDNGWMRRSEDR